MTGPDIWTTDPLLRAMRFISFFAFLALLSLVIIDPTRADNATRAMLIGAILLQLGFEVVVKLPEVIARRRDNGQDKKGDVTP